MNKKIKKNLSLITLSFLLLFTSCKTTQVPTDKFYKTVLVEHYRNKDYEYVIKELDSHKIGESKEEAGLWYLYGLCKFYTNKTDDALESFGKVLTYFPENYEVLNNIGVCLFMKKDYLNAMEFFHMSFYYNTNYKIAIDNYNTAYYNYSAKNNKSMPLKGLNENPLEYNSMGWFYYYLGDMPNAIYYFKKSIKEDPDYQFSYISLGYLYDEQKNYKTALQYLEKAKKIDANNPDLLNNLGVLYYHLNKKSSAKQSFLEAIELNNYFPEPYNNLGFVYLDENKLDDAADFFTKSLELNVQNNHLRAESYAGLAFICSMKNDSVQAKRYKNFAIKSDYKINEISYLCDVLQWDKKFIDLWKSL